MIVFDTVKALQEHLLQASALGRTIGFAPTMGALHQGHISLIEASRRTAGLTVCSIFVNPAQFNDPNDYARYPITIERDTAMLEAAGTDVLFLPPVSEIYPGGLDDLELYDLGFLETVLEGKYRPGHFQGVCRVMSRLLRTVRPHHLFMGQKDYQQCMVIRRLLQLMDIDDRVRLHISPTLREADGLAMSSRNLRLEPGHRSQAASISAALQYIKDNIASGDSGQLISDASAIILDHGLRLDYLELADANTLTPVTSWDGRQSMVALAAAFLGDVRLIDNMVIS